MGLQEKKAAIEELLKGDHILVHLNTTFPSLDTPEHLLNGPTLTLKLSWHFNGAMEIGEDEITADLVFHGSYYTCTVPFDAIWAASDAEGKTTMWPESLTPEIVQALQGDLSSSIDGDEERQHPNTTGSSGSNPKGPMLTAVKKKEHSEQEDENPEEETPKKSSRVIPVLRRVK